MHTQNQYTYESVRQGWEEAADLRSLFPALPEVFRRETLENRKEHYQELQELLSGAAGIVSGWDTSDPERFADISSYLLMLARTIPEIDEEVFDHRMNAVREYRRTLRALLSASWAREALLGEAPSALCTLPEEEGREAVGRLRESIGLSCENRVLLREKYEKYLEGGRHEV